MEPLRQEQKERILRDRPLAEPEDIEEYERLLAERFTRDPSVVAAPPTPKGVSASGPLRTIPAVDSERQREDRLRELYNILFGPS